MNRLALSALGALSCVLAIMVLLELRGFGNQQANPGAALSEPISLPASGHTPPAGPAVSVEALGGWADTILQRPLFSPSRRPGNTEAASTEVPRLAGIIIGPGGAKAIFASSGDTRAIIVGAGGHAGPYLIRAVSLTGVAVIGPNGLELLHPSYDHNPSQAGSAAPGMGGFNAGTSSILDLLRSRVQSGGLMPGLPTSPMLQVRRSQSPPSQNGASQNPASQNPASQSPAAPPGPGPQR